MRPEPFKVRFVPRSEKHRDMVQEEAAKATDFLQQFEGETKVEMEPLEAF
jgi:hypothetical protein